MLNGPIPPHVDPRKLADTIEEVSPYLTTDEGLTAGEMTKLGLSLRSIRGDDLYFLSVPHGGPTTTSGGASASAAVRSRHHRA